MKKYYAPQGTSPASVQQEAIIWCTTPERKLNLQFRPHLARQGGAQDWQEVRHGYRPATTVWNGKTLHTLTLELFFDRSRSEGDVEEECHLLHQMSIGSEFHKTGKEPERVRLNFGAHQPLRWVITGLSWGSNPLIDPTTGRRKSQGVTVDLLEYTPTGLADLSPTQIAQKG